MTTRTPKPFPWRRNLRTTNQILATRAKIESRPTTYCGRAGVWHCLPAAAASITQLCLIDRLMRRGAASTDLKLTGDHRRSLDHLIALETKRSAQLFRPPTDLKPYVAKLVEEVHRMRRVIEHSGGRSLRMCPRRTLACVTFVSTRVC